MKINKSYLIKIIQEALAEVLEEQRIRGLAPGSRRNRRYIRNNPQYFGDYRRRQPQFGDNRRRNRRNRRRARQRDRDAFTTSRDRGDEFTTTNTPPTPPYARGTMGGRRQDPSLANQRPRPRRTPRRDGQDPYEMAIASGLIDKQYDDFFPDEVTGEPKWQLRAQIAQQNKRRSEREKTRQRAKDAFSDLDSRMDGYDEKPAPAPKPKAAAKPKAAPLDLGLGVAIPSKYDDLNADELRDTKKDLQNMDDPKAGDHIKVVDKLIKQKTKPKAEPIGRPMKVPDETAARSGAMFGVRLSKGGTISHVARKYGYSTKELLKYNNLTGDDATKLPVGFLVRLPGKDEAPAAAPKQKPKQNIKDPLTNLAAKAIRPSQLKKPKPADEFDLSDESFKVGRGGFGPKTPYEPGPTAKKIRGKVDNATKLQTPFAQTASDDNLQDMLDQAKKAQAQQNTNEQKDRRIKISKK